MFLKFLILWSIVAQHHFKRRNDHEDANSTNHSTFILQVLFFSGHLSVLSIVFSISIVLIVVFFPWWIISLSFLCKNHSDCFWEKISKNFVKFHIPDGSPGHLPTSQLIVTANKVGEGPWSFKKALKFGLFIQGVSFYTPGLPTSIYSLSGVRKILEQIILLTKLSLSLDLCLLSTASSSSSVSRSAPAPVAAPPAHAPAHAPVAPAPAPAGGGFMRSVMSTALGVGIGIDYNWNMQYHFLLLF